MGIKLDFVQSSSAKVGLNKNLVLDHTLKLDSRRKEILPTMLKKFYQLLKKRALEVNLAFKWLT